MIVKGPYVHHAVGVHGNLLPVLLEALSYLDIKPDFYDEEQERQTRAFLLE